MGRELRRVAMDFDWPENKVWKGFLNPFPSAAPCQTCSGSGLAIAVRRLTDRWYGNAPFRPEENGSAPFTPEDQQIRLFAERNVSSAPGFYGRDSGAIDRETVRLCDLFNGQWSHHLNAEDVAALIASNRLIEFTHTFDPVNRWQLKVPIYIPTPLEVNIWSISGMGHDFINQLVCIKAVCERRGVAYSCASCEGEGEHWPNAEAKEAYEEWECTDPPTGDGYQIWETVSEGSPISPVFATPDELARHMAGTRWGADGGTPYETWLSFINGPGWAPSMIGTPGNMKTGVEGIVALAAEVTI